MSEVNEVPTYQPPEGVNGPTLGRDLPDGCERLRASIYPNFRDEWWDGPGVTNDCLYWWRTVPLKVGDTVQLTGTVETERVPWWEAFGRQLASNGEEILELRLTGDGVSVWTRPTGWAFGSCSGEDALPLDGTVEVLKDGDQ